MKLSKFTIFFSAYIIISSLFMSRVREAWEAIFGLKGLILCFILLFASATSAILYSNIKSGLNAKRISLSLGFCAWGSIFAWRQPYFSEKAHVLEFALLGWLVMKDLNKGLADLLKNACLALIFIALIGSLEEGFQKFLPWRVCDIRDIITDALSGGLGVILYINSKPKIKPG